MLAIEFRITLCTPRPQRGAYSDYSEHPVECWRVQKVAERLNLNLALLLYFFYCLNLETRLHSLLLDGLAPHDLIFHRRVPHFLSGSVHVSFVFSPPIYCILALPARCYNA